MVKSFIYWTKQNYKPITVILLTVIAVFVCIMFIFWFRERFFPTLDNNNATLFNDIVTPIAAVLSVILFSYFTWQQFRLQRSASLKVDFDTELARLEKELGDSITKRVQIAVGESFGSVLPAYTFSDMNSLNFISEIEKAIDVICSNDDYIEDHASYLNNKDIVLSQKYVRGRSYFRVLEFLLNIVEFPTYKFTLVEDFLTEIDKSQMVSSDRKYFKRKVRSAFLQRYLDFIAHQSGVVFPYYTQAGEVRWSDYRSTGLGRFYKGFQASLYRY